MGWVVFGFMTIAYGVGWLLGPTVARLTNPTQ
jgi:hypothetical protein